MTGPEHLTWCVNRAMERADAGGMDQAWVSFTQNLRRHPDTAHIAGHPMLSMAMCSGAFNAPTAFRSFISGWAVAA